MNPKSIVLFVVVSALFLFSVGLVEGETTFYYFIQQWPGSYCAGKRGCCYPKTGKPAQDFLIYGLRPYTFSGAPLTNCDTHDRLNPSKISNLTSAMQRHWPSLACPSRSATRVWSNEWRKYGTCAKPVLDQRHYFESALNLKNKVNLLGVLKNAGIQPDGRSYNLYDASEAIRVAIGYLPGIYCTGDKSGNSLLHLIYLCTSTGSRFDDCPGLNPSNCKSSFKFLPF